MQAKTKQFPLRMSEEEYNKLKDAAWMHRMSAAEYIRYCMDFTAANETEKPKPPQS